MKKVIASSKHLNIKPQNARLKQVRKALNLNQREFAEKLAIKQGTLSDIERGRISVSSNISESLVKKLDVNAGWFHTGVGDIFNYKMQGGNAGFMQGSETKNNKKERNKYSYIYQFRQLLEKENRQLSELSKDVLEILSCNQLIDDLHESKIGYALFFGVDIIREIEKFSEFKKTGLQALTEILPYEKPIHDFAQAIRKFVKELSLIKDEINLNFDFDDYYWQESKTDDTSKK